MAPSSEQYAQLAALFTTNEETSIRATIELLLPAHLPVQGGLWLVPYAGRTCNQGVCILVRMHEDSVDVAAIGAGNFDITSCKTIEEVIETVGVPISNWVVQPPVDADPTSLLHCDADCVTLLSGADQAAVVGAYRLLKGLIAATDNPDTMPPIRVVIVGAEEKTSNDAASRIVQTAHHQLGVSLEVGQPLPAMGSSSNVISQVSFSRISNVVDFVGRLRTEVQKVEVEVEVEEALPLTSRFDTSADEPAEQVKVAPEIKEALEQAPPVEMEPVSEEAETNADDFASHIDGLLSITPRCPEHEHVELALDTNGQLHVLVHAEDFRDAAIVAGWSRKHHSLLSMACGGLTIDASSPVQHLFTDNAVAVADLHGSGVKLHLLTTVEVAGNTGLFSTPLN
jgi:hypothetical protein